MWLYCFLTWLALLIMNAGLFKTRSHSSQFGCRWTTKLGVHYQYLFGERRWWNHLRDLPLQFLILDSRGGIDRDDLHLACSRSIIHDRIWLPISWQPAFIPALICLAEHLPKLLDLNTRLLVEIPSLLCWGDLNLEMVPSKLIHDNH